MKINCLILLSTCIVFCTCKTSKTIAYTPSPSMQVECIQWASDGSCIVSIQETGPSVEAATEAALKSAVYQLLFHGLKGSATNRIQTTPALIKDESVRKEKKDYFHSFFKDGTYRNYAECIPGSIPNIVKITGGYKVTVTIILKKDSLRKKLESDNIIKSLSNVI